MKSPATSSLLFSLDQPLLPGLFHPELPILRQPSLLFHYFCIMILFLLQAKRYMQFCSISTYPMLFLFL